MSLRLCPVVLLLTCSCAWWGAEARLSVDGAAVDSLSAFQRVRSVLQEHGFKPAHLNELRGKLVTEWSHVSHLWPRPPGENRTHRLKLSVKSQENGREIVVAFRYQVWIEMTVCIQEENSSYDWEVSLWEDRCPVWVLEYVDSLLREAVQKLGPGTDIRWTLMVPPEISGPHRLDLPVKVPVRIKP